MHFLTTIATALVATCAAASPIARRDGRAQPDTINPYVGQLVLPETGQSVARGGNFSFSYLPSPNSGTPHYGNIIRSVDVGLQGPAPIVADPYSYGSDAIAEVATGISLGGPGGYGNASIHVNPDQFYKTGTYYVIVTEHQLPAYTAYADTYRVQSYNVSIEVTEAADSSESD